VINAKRSSISRERSVQHLVKPHTDSLGACFVVEHSIDALQWYYESNFPELFGG
jgi:hypothetical protein